MASGEIKAPVTIWAIGTAFIFAGFYQLSIGLHTLILLGKFEVTETMMGKMGVGVYLMLLGTALVFVIAWGRWLTIFGAVAGIVLGFLKCNWVGFMLHDEAVPCTYPPFTGNLICGMALCLGMALYLLFSPAVAGAFYRAQRQRKGKFEEESIF